MGGAGVSIVAQHDHPFADERGDDPEDQNDATPLPLLGHPVLRGKTRNQQRNKTKDQHVQEKQRPHAGMRGVTGWKVMQRRERKSTRPHNRTDITHHVPTGMRHDLRRSVGDPMQHPKH